MDNLDIPKPLHIFTITSVFILIACVVLIVIYEFVLKEDASTNTNRSVEKLSDATEVRAFEGTTNVELVDNMVVDGVTISTDDKFVLAAQKNTAENGIYESNTAADGAKTSLWIKSGDIPDMINILSGEKNNNKTIVSNTNGSWNVVNQTPDHNLLKNYVPNEHVDHSQVSINGENGIVGGGDLTSDISLGLDISGLDTRTSVANTDTMLVQTSDGSIFKSLVSNVVTQQSMTINSNTEVTTLDNLDEFVLYDVSDSTSKKISANNLSLQLMSLANDANLDHTTIFMNTNAGSGLTGGGDISTSRSLSLDINGLSLNAAVTSAFELAMFNGSSVTKATVADVLGLIDHDNLTNYELNEHIDHSTVSITAGLGISGGGTIASTRTLNMDIAGLGTGSIATTHEIAVYNGSTILRQTISDIVGLVDHDNLTNYEPNEHIDHTTVEITAGLGLSGGGTIEQTRTVDLDIGGLSIGTLALIDEFPAYNGTTILRHSVSSLIDLVDHNTLTNHVANEHVDHSTVSVLAGLGLDGGGTIDGNLTVNLDIDGLLATNTLTLTDEVAVSDGTSIFRHTITDIIGLVDHNTLTNHVPSEHVDHSTLSIIAGLGLSGGGTIDSNVTINLEITTLTAGTLTTAHEFAVHNGSAVVKNTVADVISLIDHDTLANYDANKHVDHSTVSISAGLGLSGGGTIATTRTVALDIDGLSTGLLAATHHFALSDGSTILKHTVNDVTSIIDHDALLNHHVNQHIDHADVSIMAGLGLSGGGTIAATRTLDLDINSLTTGTIALSDSFAVFNGSTVVKNTFTDLVAILDHHSLQNYEINEHIDHNTVSVTAGLGLSGGGTITESRTIDLDIINLAVGTFAMTDTFAVYDGTTIVKNTFNDMLAVLNHDSLQNYEPNEHVDHSMVSITAGLGLSGGGTIASTRNIDLNINGLTAGTMALTDTIALYNGATIVQNPLSDLLSILNHNSFAGFLPNEHVDHSAVSILVGTGLTGGGDITTTRTIEYQWPSLTQTTITPVDAHELVGHDGTNHVRTSADLILSRRSYYWAEQAGFDTDVQYETAGSTIAWGTDTTVVSLTINNPIAGDYELSGTCTVSSSLNNRSYYVALFLNGSRIYTITTEPKDNNLVTAGNNDEQQIGVHMMRIVALASVVNTLEIRISAREAGGSAVTVQAKQGTVIAKRVITPV